MDYVTRQFINLTKHFRKDLRKLLNDLRNAMEKNTSAAQVAAQTHKDQSDTNRELLTAFENSRARERESKTQESPRKPMQWIKLAMEILTLIAVVSYTVVATYQLVEMRITSEAAVDSAKAAKDAADVNRLALYSVQRAYIYFPPSPQITIYPSSTGGVYMISMPMENAGNTQAHAMKDRVSCKITMGVLPEDFTFPDKEGECGSPWVANGANGLAAKGGILTQSVAIDNKTVQEFIQQNPVNGPWQGRIGVPDHPTRGIIFYGWVVYRDIFPNSPEHLTEFCRDLQTLVLVGTAQAAWGYCNTHNCSDEDCPDYKERLRIADSAPTYRPPKWAKPRRPVTKQ